jgi:hypothetical protein
MAEKPPFPFFGAGDATYFEWAEVHVLFARNPTPDERKAISKGVPVPLRDTITWKGRHLVAASGQMVHVEIAETWPEKKKAKPRDDDEGDGDDEEGRFFFASDTQVDRFNDDIERWLLASHALCPILAAYRGEDEESGGTHLSGWHRWSLKQLPGLWKSLEEIRRDGKSPTPLAGIAAFASRAKIRVPQEYKPAPVVNVRAPGRKIKTGPGRNAVLDLVAKLGFGRTFDGRLREEAADEDEDYFSEDLVGDVIDHGLRGPRSKLLAELTAACRKSKLLGEQVAYHAYQCMKSRIKDAIDLFEVVARTPGLSLQSYNNAVGALTVKGKLETTPERERKFIEAVLPYGKKNPCIHANVACIHVLRGRVDDAFDQLELSVKRGHDRALISKDRVFKSLRALPRYRSLMTVTGP